MKLKAEDIIRISCQSPHLNDLEIRSEELDDSTLIQLERSLTRLKEGIEPFRQNEPLSEEAFIIKLNDETVFQLSSFKRTPLDVLIIKYILMNKRSPENPLGVMLSKH